MNRKRLKPLLYLIPFALGLYPLLRMTRCWYFADDFYWINYGFKSFGDISEIWTHTFFNYYRPTVNLVFTVEMLWAGLSAVPRHLLNLLIHGVSSGLLALWLFRHTRSSLVSITSALLFFLGPIHIETVIWISGRTDLIAALCLLLMVCLAPDLYAPTRFRSWRQGISLFCLLMGIFSKELVVLAPVILAVSDWSMSSENQELSCRSWFRVRRDYILVSIIGVVVHGAIQLTGNITFAQLDSDMSVAVWLWNVTGGVALCLFQFVPGWFRMDPTGIIGFLMIVSGAIILFRYKERRLISGAVIALVLMIPAAAVPFRLLPDPHLTFGRFIYIPMIGATLIVAGGITAATSRMESRRLSQSLVILVMLSALVSGGLKSQETIHRWQMITSTRLQTVQSVIKMIETVPQDRAIVIMVEDQSVWSEMFTLFMPHADITVVRSHQGINVKDKEFFVFNNQEGKLRRISR